MALLLVYRNLVKKKGRTQCTRLPLYAGSGRGECRLALPPFYGEAAPKSRTRDLPLMGEGTCHRTKCDLSVHKAPALIT
ncbi:unnamed protein product [Malus baccata var. baccata]